jgi:uncharacterized membrane protein
MAGVAWLILQHRIIVRNGADSPVARALGRDVKGKSSAALYALAIALAFVRPWIAYAIYALVALLWVVPDRRIEALVGE